MHSPPPQEVSHQFQEANGSRNKASNNAKTPGETYTSLQYHWLSGKSTIWKFVPQVCRVILFEFQEEYLCCPDSPEDLKRVKEKFRWKVQMECPPRHRGHKWEAYHHEEAKENRK